MVIDPRDEGVAEVKEVVIYGTSVGGESSGVPSMREVELAVVFEIRCGAPLSDFRHGGGGVSVLGDGGGVVVLCG